jgi:hypothetical protein
MMQELMIPEKKEKRIYWMGSTDTDQQDECEHPE